MQTSCSLRSCYTVDFLPVVCGLCKKDYCGVHAFPDAHACSAAAETVQPLSLNNAREHCSFVGCLNPTPVFTNDDGSAMPPPTCGDCSELFCLSHRHQSSHACPGLKQEPAGPSKAQQMASHAIAQLRSSQTQTKPKSVPKNAKMKAVELMKLRRKAEPANPRDDLSSVPMDERVIVELTYNATTMVLWVKNDVIAGRALDLFAAKMGIHISPLQLKQESGEIIKTDELLSTQVETPCKLAIERANS